MGLIFNTIAHASAQLVDENDELPTNICCVIDDVGCDELTYNAKAKRTFNAVLFEICNFRYWIEDKVCKKIMDTMFQMQQEDKMMTRPTKQHLSSP